MIAIKIENLWKEYRLGVIGHGTLTHDLQAWWARIRGQEDPNSKIDFLLSGQESQVEGNSFWALRGIDLEVKEGEVLGIIGKNGAGKSTLLKILSRVTAPTKGMVKAKGSISSLLEVGTGFHPELTGVENIFLNGAILGMSKWEVRKKLDQIIDFSGIDKHIDTPVKRYSSGMYVRLAFAVAANLEAEILIIDEVLAVGDAEFQKKCLGKMDEIARAGRTVLFVSHNLSAVSNLCSRAILVDGGKIVKSGNVNSTVSYYLENTISDNNADLSCRDDRKGSGLVRFTKTFLCDDDGEKNEFVKLGQSCNILVQCRISGKIDVDSFRIIISISTVYGVRVTALNTWVTGDRILADKKLVTMVCRVNKFNLNCGVYLYKITAMDDHGLHDLVDNAGKIVVSAGNVFGNDRCINEKFPVVLEHSWNSVDEEA